MLGKRCGFVGTKCINGQKKKKKKKEKGQQRLKNGKKWYNLIPYEIVGIIIAFIHTHANNVNYSFDMWKYATRLLRRYRRVDSIFNAYITRHLLFSYRLNVSNTIEIRHMTQCYKNKPKYTDLFIQNLKLTIMTYYPFTNDRMTEKQKIKNYSNLKELSKYVDIKILSLSCRNMSNREIQDNLGLNGLIHLSVLCNDDVFTTNSLPSTLKTLNLVRFDSEIKIGTLPDSLESLTLGDNFNSVINVGALPQSLTELRLGFRYDKDIVPGMLPLKLEELFLGNDFNKELVIGALPQSLKKLIFGSYNNRYYNLTLALMRIVSSSYDSVSPENQKLGREIYDGTAQNCDYTPIGLNVLPVNLNVFVCSWSYNKKINIGVIPSSLTVLVLGYRFNQPLEVGVFPNTLTTLVFGSRFNQSISKGLFPLTLTALTFGSDFNQNISKGRLPPFLTYLMIGFYHYIHEHISCKIIFPDELPYTLKVLRYNDYGIAAMMKKLPLSLRLLIVARSYTLTDSCYPSSAVRKYGFKKRIYKHYTCYYKGMFHKSQVQKYFL